ncbi:MAG: hypothetical protein MSL09_07300, partial [Spirochaetia bacterium]|nr:hypothetical protein [Spirochaetia bacterium]
ITLYNKTMPRKTCDQPNYAHTQMALRMLDDGKAVQMTENLDMDITAYQLSQHLGDDTIFSDYVAGNYDSSADYWKLMDDGSIAYDGQADLYDVNGNLIYKTQSRGLEGSLVEILYGKNATPEEVEKVQQLMVKSGMLHTVDKQNPTSSDLWRWDVIGSVGDNALNKWFFTENVDVKEHNMGKVISLTGIRDVLASSDNSSTDAADFIERVYAKPINLLNYVDGNKREAVYGTDAFPQELTAEFSNVLQQSSYLESLRDKSAADGILKMIYTDEQLAIIRENQKLYNKIVSEGQNIQESMINNAARNTHDFDIVSDLLKLETSSVPNAVFLIEEHPGYDFGRAEAGATVDSPGGYWQFLGKASDDPKEHRAAFQLYGSDLNMRIQHLNPAGITMEKDKVYGDGTSNYKLFDYPTESHGSGTAPHIHIEFTRLLPYDNRAYVSQYVHPDTLQPGNRFKYNLNYYDKDMNLVEPRRYAQNFGRPEREECKDLYW